MDKVRFWVTTLCLLSVLAGCLCPVAAQDLAARLLEAQRLDEQVARLYQAGRYDAAIPLAEKVLAILETTLGGEYPNTANAVRSLAILYIAKGDYARADPLQQRSLLILQNYYHAEHPIVADSLTFISVFYFRRGDYGRAELLLKRALAIAEKAFTEEHQAVALILNNLAGVYEAKGDYGRAEPLYQRSLQIREKVLNPEHPDVGVVLNNLAGLYWKKGDYRRAELLYERALTIIEKELGTEHPNVATALNNLAGVYKAKGNYARAESSYKRALAIRERTLAKDHPDVANSLNGLALLYWTKREYERAEPLYERALSIIEKQWGAEHPAVCTILNNLGTLNSAKGDYARAESFYKGALAICEKVYGNEHADVASILINLTTLYEIQGHYVRALAFLQRAVEIEEKNIAQILVPGSQQEKQLYLNTLLGETFATVSLHVRDLKDNADAARLALTVILQRKGRVLDVMSDQIAALRHRASQDDQTLLDKLIDTHSRLARLQVSSVENLNSDAQRAEIVRLEAEQELLEDNISRRSGEFRTSAQPITFDAVREALPPDAALVELFVYYPANTKTPGPLFGVPHYVAYVLHRQDAVPQWVELGDAGSVNILVEQLRAALRDPKREDVMQLARGLDERVTRPIRKLAGPTRRLFLAPDGALNLIPFASLVDENGRYLIENYSINYLTSGRDLLHLRVSGENRETPKVFADPVYDLAAKIRSRPNSTQSTSSLAGSNTEAIPVKSLGGLNYRRLSGTADEAAALGKLFSDASLFLQARATEAAMKKVSRPRFLHIATHGFFLTDQPNPPISRTLGFGLSTGNDTGPVTSGRGENPLLRSGLILAGVKQQSSGPGEDGVLTAMEVASLDLIGTRLVVLSACETGLGDVKTGDGVYGLRRALVLAGSETQVMSLWKVSDSGTRDLMTAYYTRLQKGEGRAEALRQVQLMMLRGELTSSAVAQTIKRGTTDTAEGARIRNYRHPYYWAAFIQSGDWRGMEMR